MVFWFIAGVSVTTGISAVELGWDEFLNDLLLPLIISLILKKKSLSIYLHQVQNFEKLKINLDLLIGICYKTYKLWKMSFCCWILPQSFYSKNYQHIIFKSSKLDLRPTIIIKRVNFTK